MLDHRGWHKGIKKKCWSVVALGLGSCAGGVFGLLKNWMAAVTLQQRSAAKVFCALTLKASTDDSAAVPHYAQRALRTGGDAFQTL